MSNAQLTSSTTFANTSFASLGVTPGTYVWTWGTGVNADSLTIRISNPAVIPLPASAVLRGTGLLGFATLGRRRTGARKATA